MFSILASFNCSQRHCPPFLTPSSSPSNIQLGFSTTKVTLAELPFHIAGQSFSVAEKTSSVGCRGLPGQSQPSLPSSAIILLLSHNICRLCRIITPFLDSETVQFWLSLVCQKAHSSNEPEIGNTGSSPVSQFELPLVILSQTCLLRSPPR